LSLNVLDLLFFNKEGLVTINEISSDDIEQNNLYILKLVRKAKNGDQESFDKLLNHLDPHIKNMCHKYYLPGFDKEDILQIARITLYRAVQDFSDDKNTTFEHFALKICIRKRLITEIYRTQRQKHLPLNTAKSLDTPLGGDYENDNSSTMCDYIVDEEGDPLNKLLHEEEIDELRLALYGKLTDLEASVLEAREEEKTYKGIARKLDISTKCVDNSLGRVRKKLKSVCGGLYDFNFEDD